MNNKPLRAPYCLTQTAYYFRLLTFFTRAMTKLETCLPRDGDNKEVFNNGMM